MAVENGHKDVAKLLMANKADINAKDKYGTSPLRMALSYGYTNVAKLLREDGATNN